ncbi:hypothetical protein ACFLYC_03235 [Chloroflexota bacterium]
MVVYYDATRLLGQIAPEALLLRAREADRVIPRAVNPEKLTVSVIIARNAPQLK